MLRLIRFKVAAEKKIKILGVLFNGNETPATEEYIASFGKVAVLGRMNHRKYLNREAIQIEAQNIRNEVEKYF